jgi:glutathione S-transferase
MNMNHKLILVSHLLCPYVQRAVIVMKEKGVPFERLDIDLANKPEWFLKASPLGKTPLLLVDDQAIFESAVICEYLDETVGKAMHPIDPLERARHRAWIEFASATLNGIGAMYGAPDDETLHAKVKALAEKFEQVELALKERKHAGPFFAGEHFCIVDAAFAPVFRYFDVFDQIEDFGVFSNTPLVNAWRLTLENRESVKQSVRSDYHPLLRDFLIRRKSAISIRLTSRIETGSNHV